MSFPASVPRFFRFPVNSPVLRSADGSQLRADRNIAEIIDRMASRSVPRGVTAGKRVRNPAMGNKRCS